MKQHTKCKIYPMMLSVIIGLSLLAPSVVMHEIGHAVACVWQGFEVIEINLLLSYMICSESDNQIVHIMGGALGGASMLPFLLIKRIRSYLPVSLGLVTAAITQLLNMILEGFSNLTYRAFDLENLVFALGIIMIISLVFLLRSRLCKYHII